MVEVVKTGVEAETGGLNLLRYKVISNFVKIIHPKSILDMGCGIGMFIRYLHEVTPIEDIRGIDINERNVHIAGKKGCADVKVGSVLEFQECYSGYELVTLLEVIEHLDKSQLESAMEVVFDKISPGYVIITTPGREYNVNYKGKFNGLRAKDHKFEFDRTEFVTFCDEVGAKYGYSTWISGIGDGTPDTGSPTLFCMFTKVDNGKKIEG